MMKKLFTNLILISLPVIMTAQTVSGPEIEAWTTSADRSSLFKKTEEKLVFSDNSRGRGLPIIIDESHRMQIVDGFGFALTGGSAELLMKMTPSARKKLLEEVFSNSGSSIGVSYLRLTIGASDMNSFVYSYDDLKEGESDPELKKFDLGHDRKDVIPVMKEILSISPEIRILASPWSPPVWMKSNGKVKAGSLKPECYPVYAQYFVRYVQEMKKNGIIIDAVTVQNEPLNANNTPSMRMSAAEQADFIKNHLGPAFAKADIKTKIVLFDHNLDRPDYPLSILNDPETAKYVDGSGFHHYGGEISAMSILHTAFPDKNLYFTEQMVTEKPGTTSIDIAAQVKRLIIGTMQNWSRNSILWNLAADPSFDPHTNDGGCPICQGAVTIEGDNYSRNIAFYVVAHASKFVTPGSIRIGSTQSGDMSVNLTSDEERREVMRIATQNSKDVLPNVAFRTPEGKTVLIVANDSNYISAFRLQHKGKSVMIRLAPGSVGTYIW